MNPLDILNFLRPEFSDLLQASFFGVMLTMLLLTVISVSITASARAWEKKWNHASNSKSGVSQGIEQGGVTDLFHIVATRPEKLAEVMPGMLLIVGLLGTFIGLGLALDKASSILGASNAMDAAGAADGLQNMLGMLKGLGTKFKTSTWGIAGFILMKVWSEVTQFEEKRLAWVIGKVKKESEARNALLAAAEEEKWKKSVQLGSAMTSRLVAAFEKSVERSLQSAAENNRELVTKNAEFLTAQTNALSDQQHEIAKSNTETLREMIAGQTAVHALFDRHARTMLQHANERGNRHEHLLNAMSLQHGEIATRSESALRELFAQHTDAINTQQKSQANDHAVLFRQLVNEQKTAYELMFKHNLEAATNNTTSLGDRIEAQLSALNRQQETLANQNRQTMTDLFTEQTKTLNEQQKEDMRENTRVIGLLGDNMQRVADASKQTNDAMRSFTDNTQTVVSNMDSAAQRMAAGADKVGSAAENLHLAVGAFENQFTDVLGKVRTDLSAAIKEMSDRASDTLAMGSKELSNATAKISQSLEHLSGEMTGTMTRVHESIKDAQAIQNRAFVQFSTTSQSLEEAVRSTTEDIGKLSTPIEDGLKSISKHSAQLRAVALTMNNGVELAQTVSSNLSMLTDSFAHFESIPLVIDKLVTTLEPMKKIQASLDDVHKQIASRPAAETGIAREINDKLSRALSPLNDIQSLLKEVRSDLANRPVPQPGVVPKSLVKELSHQLQQAITNANAQRTLTQASVSAVALSK